MGKALSTVLKEVRSDKGLSLRKVEKDIKVSNAYLSQLETGQATKPSPELLKRLANYYGIRYEMLMEAAGYLERKASTKGGRELNAKLEAVLMSTELSKEDEERVAVFVRFLRSERRKRGQ